MTTTVVRNSIVGDDWIRQVQANVPIQKIVKPDANGVMQWTGDFLSGPVRLSWVNLFTAKASKDSAGNIRVGSEKFSTAMLFPPPLPGQTKEQQFALLYEEYYRVAAKDFASHWDAGSQQYYGLHSPFHDQGEKFKYEGYTPGCIYVTMGSKFKPPVVRPIPGDPNNFNPVVNEAEVYPGVWAIVAFNCYAGGKGQPVKGPMFGIQSVIIIGDDTNISGGGAGADPKKQFAGLALPTAIQRPNLANIPGVGGGLPGMPSVAPPPSIPGYPSAAPAMPVVPSYAPAPPPPSADDDYSFMQ